MKKSVLSMVLALLLVLLSSCATSPIPVPTSTPVSPTFTASPIPPTSTPEPTAMLAPASNPFVGYWAQIKLSEHPLGMAVCGNSQNIEFFEDGTFTVSNDFSGIYKEFDPGFGTSTASGTYNILGEKQIEIKYDSDDDATAWEYIFSGNALTMSSPAPVEFGGGLIACYFSKSSK